MRIEGICRIAALVSAVSLAAGGAHAGPGFRAIYSFTGGVDGQIATGKLLRDAAGNLYGVTIAGGNGVGTVFELPPGGTLTTRYSFVYQIGQPADPVAGVVMDAAGNLYGEAEVGGAMSCSDGSSYAPYCGSVYKLAPDNTLTVLYSFQGGTDGGRPSGGLLLDKYGNLYGTTSEYGSSDFCPNGCGTVFKITPSGTMTTLYSFLGKADGGNPAGGLIADKLHNLYGTAGGGTAGYGIVFKLAPNGTKTVLYNFLGGTDGNIPASGVVADAAGNLYGTTQTGGGSAETGVYGTFFKLAPDGTKTTVHIFGTDEFDGRSPTGNLLIDKQGDIYGTTWQGGVGCKGVGCGTVFEVAHGDTYARLYTLNSRFGHAPLGGLVSDAKNNLFGNSRGPKYDENGIVYTMRK